MLEVMYTPENKHFSELGRVKQGTTSLPTTECSSVVIFNLLSLSVFVKSRKNICLKVSEAEAEFEFNKFSQVSFLIYKTFILPVVIVPVLSKQRTSTLARVSTQYNS